MKNIKKILLSLVSLLLLQQMSYAQVTEIDVSGNNQVCTGTLLTYGYTSNSSTNTQVNSVSINPSTAGTIYTSSFGFITIVWNNSLTTASISINYTYESTENVYGDPSNPNKVTGTKKVPHTETITSSSIGLKAPTGSISGPTSIVCTDPTDVTYTVNGSHTSFSVLSYPSNGNGAWTLSSLSQTNSTFTMHPNIGVSGNISVSIVDANCNNSSSTIYLNDIKRPAAKPQLTASTQTYLKNVPINFSIASIPLATSYTYSAVIQNTTSADNVIIEPRTATSTDATITFKYSGTYILTVGYTGGDSRCGNGATKDYTINVTCPEPVNVTQCATTQLISLPYSASGTDGDLYPRFVKDINRDGKDDIIIFSAAGLSVALTNPSNSLYTPLTVISTYWAGNSSKWPKQSITPRFLADVDGANGVDIVGFALDGIYVSLNDGSGNFAAPAVWSNSSTPKFWSGTVIGGIYSPGVLTRIMMGDINGDYKEDIIYTDASHTSVLYSRQNNPGFKVPEIIANCDFFNATTFPNNAQTPMRLAYVNADALLDLLMFTYDGVRVAIQNQDHTFQAPINWSTYLGSNDGYPNQSEYPRILKDMNKDGHADIVAFGTNFVKVAINNQAGHFLDPVKWTEGYSTDVNGGGINSGYINMDVNPRLLGDVDGDGYPDLVGFKQNFVAVSKNIGGTAFACPDYLYNNNNGGPYTGNVGYTSQNYFPRYLANIDGDNRVEILGFYKDKVEATNCTTYFRQGVDETEVTAASNVLTCYPNPASDAINFKIANMNGSASIVIYDGAGSKIKEITNEDLASGSYTLNTSSLLSGVYYYQYTDGSGNLKADKFIIMK